MRKLIFRLMIVLSFLLATERVKAQPAPPASYAEFIQALGSFGLGGDALRATLQGLTNLAIELGQADAALVARLRSTSSIRQLILEVIRSNPELRAAVVARIRTLTATGAPARKLLANRNTWRGLQRGAANLHVVLAVATAIVSGTIGYAVGVRLVRLKKRWEQQQDNTKKTERYAHHVQRMLRQTKHGSAKLCGGMTYSEAATRLQINMHVSPNSPFRGILCPVSDSDAKPCSPKQISGTYRASWGPIKCRQAGTDVDCCYGSNCKWDLHLSLSGDGQKLKGTWDHNDGRTGPVEFGLSKDCDLTSGRYGSEPGKLTHGWSVTSKSREPVAGSEKCETFLRRVGLQYQWNNLRQNRQQLRWSD